jgi:hypothetical protein
VVERERAAPEREERVMDVAPTLVTHGEATHLVEVREGPLHDPTVSPEPGAGVHAVPGDARLDAARRERPPGLWGAVRPDGVPIGRTSARTPHLAPDRRDGVEQALKDGDLIPARGRQELGGRRSGACGRAGFSLPSTDRVQLPPPSPPQEPPPR